MFLAQTVAPVVAPVTLDEVKAHCVIEHDLDDALLKTFIGAATAHGENETGRGFVEAEYQLAIDRFPGPMAAYNGLGGPIELLKPPIKAVTSVAYTNREGEDVTLVVSGDYLVSLDGCVYPYYVSRRQWPTDAALWGGAVRVNYTAGYPVVNGAATTPDGIKAWLLIRIADLYENRESIVIGPGVNKLPPHFADGLLDAFRVPKVV